MTRKKYDSRKANIVGDFFEDLFGAMFPGAERAPADEGDFHLWDISTGVEVKSSDNNHELRLPLYLIEAYQRLSGGFPFDTFFFFLFWYHNPYIRENGFRITSLSRFDETVDVRNFLAANIDSLFAVDIALIPYLFSVCKVSDKSIPMHRGVKSLNVRPKHLTLLANGGWRMFSARVRDLGSKSFDCKFGFSPDLLESYTLKFHISLTGRRSGLDGLMKSFDREILSCL